MERIASLGTGIAEVVVPTYEAYSALLQRPETKAAIKSVKRETFSYGPHKRHKLDLYSPPGIADHVSQRPRPVLIFTYGGAFANGDRILDGIDGGLVYANVGAFFASEANFDTIVLDYRLLKHGAKYPSGGEDFGLGLQWVQDRYQHGGRREIYVIANSAGAVHLSTWLFSPRFAKERLQLLSASSEVRLTKVVFLGCPFRLDYHGGMKPVLEVYYGTEEDTKRAEPTQLMLTGIREKDSIDMTVMPGILTAVAELDPSFIVEPGQEFSKLWRECGGKGDHLVLRGHNHISPPLSLGTGSREEEHWGHQVVGWLRGEAL
ncbi:uncharacterized protein A1O9_10347 [Exophiala aquamarina CBS 119918]|uniref:Alpha/beta hydrolase fold-3 domain-containing protein n=1 Tax=Exophiala aquamarina CBS 119918 TaxID=1182545 RepID=A0A072P126_9EURO|nr:uncharacterized protein A1O9_10347 [Exophiala aquamarina CBS 119918]KEF53372.1 hypothetical protein A1O9_10347 [Exophiala aquamarina CBS 119918]